ncbi:MAG: hypothetical protein KDA37_08710 [Planctomycetales bacterium]|nr:hypothetical protein [Planctomycetales bacterium]
MSQLINVPLESYLLAQRSAPVECMICGFENSSTAERCCRCSSPTAFSRDTADKKVKPHLLAVVGAPGAGKTVYLGMLMDMLVRRVGGIRATVCGPYSIGLQQATTTALTSGYYPDRTPADPSSWHWVHCRLECGRTRKTTELVLADVSGDAWQQEADRPGTHPALGPLLANCSGLMVLADSQRLHGGDHSDDFIAMKLLSQLSEEKPAKRKRNRKANPKPLALVFTKSDHRHGCIEDPESFAESHAPALLSDCQARFPNLRTFGATVVGASAMRCIHGHRRESPLRVEPQGIIEPLGWLLTQM